MGGATVKLGVVISGSGTNLQAIIDAIERGQLDAEIRVVISNRANAFGLERARKHGIEAIVIDHRRFPTREDFDREVLHTMKTRAAELIICAGFDRLFSAVMRDAFPNRIMNIHPALTPAFPGLHAQRDAIEYGAKISGCTVFFVAPGIDDGAVIIQAAVPVHPDDDEQSLRARILEQEHHIYPEAIRLYQQGRLEIRGRKVVIRDHGRPADGIALINPKIE